jgi:hypothetical protein
MYYQFICLMENITWNIWQYFEKKERKLYYKHNSNKNKSKY